MGQLEILFQVPRFIEVGLANGTFQRVGGVIVDSSSKQVVAWLRDGSALEMGIEVASSAANPLNLILQAAQMATSLLDGHATRQAVGEVGKQMLENHVETMKALNDLGQSVQTIGALTMLTGTGQLLNLAMTAASFQAIMKRLDSLSEQIDELGQKIIAEFDRDRNTQFEVALQAAQDAFESEQVENRVAKANEAKSGLLSARKHFLTDFKNVLRGKPDAKQLPLAQHYLTHAMYAEISRIRCYLASGENNLAKKYLLEDMPQFEEDIEILINRWLGQNTAIYFHKDTPANYLNRFLRIQQWLRGINSGNNPIVIFQIVNEHREGFWDNSIIDNTPLSMMWKKEEHQKEQLMNLANNLSQAELLIENMERLRGFEIEVRSMQLREKSFDEWSDLVSNEDAEEHGVGIIIDEDSWVQYAHLEVK